MSKKKILLMSDDLRMSSGVGTMSREIVMGTIDHYDWVQLGGAIKHPEDGKVVDMKDAVKQETGVEDAHLMIYPISGYGNQEIVRELIHREKPDAIMIYTDPRFWIWLFQMEHEVRQNIPIFYYNIWDDLPYPMWNRDFYDSVDLLMNISKQTYNLVKNVRSYSHDWGDVTYVPHGANEDLFYPITELHSEWKELKAFRRGLLDVIPNQEDLDFILFYNNRNIRRKMPGDVVLAFKTFCDMLPKEKADKCALVMHTTPVDENGTDLPRVVDDIAPDCHVIFSTQKLESKHLNFLYNMADVTLNIASNEGWGLGTTESLMAGTPIIVNITGGLQDQCGFKYKGKYLTYKDYEWVHTLHDDRKWANNKDLTWGEWVKPVWPSNRSMVGSPPTPYIFDDRCRFDDVAQLIKDWYDEGHENRVKCGEIGRNYCFREESGMTAKLMCQNFIRDMDNTFDNWVSRKPYEMFKI